MGTLVIVVLAFSSCARFGSAQTTSQTDTLFDIGADWVGPSDGMSFVVDGVGPDGKTTYGFLLFFGDEITTNSKTTFKVFSTTTDTLIEDSTVEIFEQLATSEGEPNEIRSCSISQGTGACLEIGWNQGGHTTTTLSYTDTISPLFTLTVSPIPTRSSPSSTTTFPSPSSSGSVSINPARLIPTGPIIGGVISGLIILFVLVLLLRYRRKRVQQPSGLDALPTPFTSPDSPSDNGTAGPLSGNKMVGIKGPLPVICNRQTFWRPLRGLEGRRRLLLAPAGKIVARENRR